MISRIAVALLLAATSLWPLTAEAAATPARAGTVVSVVDLPVPQHLDEAVRSLLVVYRTRDGRHRPRVSSAAVYLPHRPNGVAVSWAHGSNGLADRCAPTRMGRPDREARYFRTLLAHGFAVVASDYIGLGTPGEPAYLDAGGEAHAMIDLVNAVHTRWPRTAQRWIADGHSQGAHAALNAAVTATISPATPRMLGTAVTSAPPPFDVAIPLAGPTVPPIPGLTGLFAMALRGFMASYPELRVDRHLTARGRTIDRAIADLCVDEIDRLTADLGIGDLLGSPLTAPENRLLRYYLRMPTRGLTTPLFIGHGLVDERLPYPTVLPTVALLRASGVDVRFRTYAADHDGVIAPSVADRLRFFDELRRSS